MKMDANTFVKIDKLEIKFDDISKKIEALEIEKSSLEESEPNTKEYKRYFKIDDEIYKLEGKQGDIQEKIEELESK